MNSDAHRGNSCKLNNFSAALRVSRRNDLLLLVTIENMEREIEHASGLQG